MLFEKYLRKAAYQLISIRDNYHGVISHKTDFHRFAADTFQNMQTHSFQRLKNILNHAFKTSPYYLELWEEIGFEPGAIKEPEDIQALPFLTKDIIEINKVRIISEEFRANGLETSYTGGSSGTPTSFFRDRACTAIKMGRQWGMLQLCGYSQGDRCGLFWGAHQDLHESNAKRSLKRAFRKFSSGKETLCCTVMNSEKMTEFHHRLTRFKPKVLYGYPNAMAEFASHVQKKKLQPLKVRTIICTAERLYEGQRKLLSEVFGCEVFNLYCTREHGCIGFECGRHDGFHLDIGSVYLEIISDGRATSIGEPGEIVVTDLLNYAMPFVRYKIGDRGTLSKKPCDCGCQLPLLSNLDGRETDMLYRPDGSTVAGVMLVDMFLDEPAIKAMQIVQENINEIDLFLVVKDDFPEETKQKAIQEISKYMGQAIRVNLRIVSNIPRNPVSGKYQEVICKINGKIGGLS